MAGDNLGPIVWPTATLSSGSDGRSRSLPQRPVRLLRALQAQLRVRLRGYRSLGRKWWGAREYELQRRNGEDLSVESLREAWNFPPADCLTFRHRVPDRWGDVPLAPGLLGAIEALCQLIPGIHFLLYIYRGLWPCAVCRLPRSTHPLQTLGEAERAFWEAMRDRDTRLAVRLVRGGVACPPDSENHELSRS